MITGASKFVMFGSCGSLDREATKGKFIVPTESIMPPLGHRVKGGKRAKNALLAERALAHIGALREEALSDVKGANA